MKDTETKKAARAGFTLVELVVVIVILGVLAGVAYPAYTGYIRKANDTKVEVELNEILLAAESSCADWGLDISGNMENGSPNGIYVGMNTKIIAVRYFSTGKCTNADGTEVTAAQFAESMKTYGEGLFKDRAENASNELFRASVGTMDPDGLRTLNGEAKNTSYEGAKWFAWSPQTGWFSELEDPDLPDGYSHDKYWVNKTATEPSAP